MIRSAFFIDGFNFYHALARLKRDELKWLNLRALMEQLISPKSEIVSAVHYFSAYPHWMPGKLIRHREYVRALEGVGVQAVIGRFKEKDGHCRACDHRWVRHEEKETDVNIALALLNEAYRNSFDRAYLVSRDSDLKPAVAMVRSQFPEKAVILVAPPQLGHSQDMMAVATGKRKITIAQLERSLFGEIVVDSGGNVVARRPAEYGPRSS